MHPRCKFPTLALPEVCWRDCRVVLVAGVMAMLSGCGRSPASEDGKNIHGALILPERPAVNPLVADAARPLTAEELARKSRLEAELAAECPTQRLTLRDGRVLDGRVVSETPSSVRFRDGFGYSGFSVESYRRANVLGVEPLPAASFQVTAQDVRFSAEFPQFHFVKSPPYTIVTDESYGEVQKILGVLTNLREQFHGTFGSLIKQDGELQDIHVVFFGSEDAFRHYALRVAPFFINSAGFFSSGENRLALLNQLGTSRYAQAQSHLDERARVFDGNADAGQQLATLRSDMTSEAKSINERVIRHEGAHQLFHAYRIQSRYGLEPTWLTEGLAQYCETPDIGRYHSVLANRVIRARDAGRLLPLKTLLNHRDPSGFFVLRRGDIELAYAESWALVYRLMQDDSRERFFDYLKSYRDIPSDRAAAAMEQAQPEALLEAHLKTDFNSLERQWDSYITHM